MAFFWWEHTFFFSLSQNKKILFGGGQFFFLEALRIGLKKIRRRFQNDPNQNKASRTQKPPKNMVFSGSKKAKN